MFFGALMILMGIWAFFFVPETKGRTLEQMEALFGAPTAFPAFVKETSSEIDEKQVGMVHVEEQQPRAEKWKISRVLSA